ncbi:MAG: two-component system response regulator [Thermoflexus sp.]|mgnify:FL=1|uniref:response regulator n=1 Tax=Thermoflexus sp. TaxID=1969742 RepID=UPI00331B320A
MTTVMVVEDDPQVVRMLVTLLELEGFRGVGCAEAERALEEIRRARPEVVVLDLHLGGHSGLELLRALRADPELQGTRVVIVSGEDRLREARAAGADAFVLKPFSLEELVEALRRLEPSKGGPQ